VSLAPLVSCRDVLVQAGGRAILDISRFDLAPRSILAVIGPNGAGKSTLLSLLAGILPPASGSVLFGGEEVYPGSTLLHRRRVTLVFQDPLLLDDTVAGNVATGLRFRGVDRARLQERVDKSMERFRISHLKKRRARNLSGGEAQRTSLARAMALEPELLLLDEPSAALDPPTRELLLDDLARTLRETGTAAVLATHDRTEALRLADRVAVMRDGRLLQTGSPEEVMNHPADEFIAGFVGVETILRGEVSSTGEGTFTVPVEGHPLVVAGEAAAGDEVILCVRPENVTLEAAPPAGPSSARNSFAGTIRRLVPLGPLVRVEIDCGFDLTALVTPPAARDLSLAAGSRVHALVKATAIHAIFPIGSHAGHRPDRRHSQA
jgi:tungstate transport system ATP-binding protein